MFTTLADPGLTHKLVSDVLEAPVLTLDPVLVGSLGCSALLLQAQCDVALVHASSYNTGGHSSISSFSGGLGPAAGAAAAVVLVCEGSTCAEVLGAVAQCLQGTRTSNVAVVVCPAGEEVRAAKLEPMLQHAHPGCSLLACVPKVRGEGGQVKLRVSCRVAVYLRVRACVCR